MMGDLFIGHDMPEPPKESFFKGLFGGGSRSLDREELCEWFYQKKKEKKFHRITDRWQQFQSANRAAEHPAPWLNTYRGRTRGPRIFASAWRQPRARWTWPIKWCWNAARSCRNSRRERRGWCRKPRASRSLPTDWCSNTRTRNGTSYEDIDRVHRSTFEFRIAYDYYIVI